MSQLMFSYFDYALFFGMLVLSVIIGIYFGCIDRGKQTKKEYVLGGKNMDVLPISVSLIASQISGITLLSVPADIYKYGSNYIWLCLSIPIACVINNYIFLPLFFQLQLTSIYEYLSLRFDKRVELIGSFLFILSTFLHNPIVIYIPALALAQATDIGLYSTIIFVCIICTFYTTVGGFKAVVWTDALQCIGMFASIGAVVYLGAKSVGGFTEVFRAALQGGRMDVFELKIDPMVRDGFWPVIIGGSIQYVSYVCFNQGYMQKFLAVRTLQKAKRALLIYCIGVIGTIATSVLTGNILYTKYYNCDPFLTKKINRSDQLLPHFVMEISKNLPGLPGIFIAGVFSAALSTFSASLNTAASAIYQDFILPYSPSIGKERESVILKIIVVISGVTCTVLALFVNKVSGVLSFSIALNSIVGGPLLGIFILGTMFPSANAKGTFYGCISGLVFLSWIVVGNQWYLNQDLFAKPISASACNNSSTVTKAVKEDPFVLYRISFWYNTLIGSIVVIGVGLAVSSFTKDQSRLVNSSLVYNIKYKLFK